MGRAPKPRYRSDRDVWYTRFRGEYNVLAEGEKNDEAAAKALDALLKQPKEKIVVVTVGAICERFLIWTEEHRSPLTLEWYKRHIDSFGGFIGAEKDAAAVKAYQVLDWIDANPWGQSTRHGAITAVKRLFRWSARLGLIESNSLEGLDRPGIKRRESILSPEQEKKVLESAPLALQALLSFLHATGCRPSEAQNLKFADIDFDGGICKLHGKTTRKTGRERVIYLNLAAHAILKRQLEIHGDGHVFRNARGGRWTRNAIAWAMGRLRRKLSLDGACTAESFRHGWITDAKLKLPNSVVAELAGHTSTAMVDRHYGHLNERKAELSAAAALVRIAGTEVAIVSGPSASLSPDLPVAESPPGSAPQTAPTRSAPPAKRRKP